jgi:hypothetical protein
VPLSWNEIRHRAITFAKEWKGESREAAERQNDCRPVPLNAARLLSFTCCPKMKSMARALEANLVRGGAGSRKLAKKCFLWNLLATDVSY